ncbi:glycosyltransferase [Alteromonas mediterranea]|uniref:glycosyltransferase family protein n=1 Tax=Alteromonas mediterranea TaxID=314275 RepID=UPI0005C5FE62|nr:glycosyltransferase [Alteromonas mediterranea]
MEKNSLSFHLYGPGWERYSGNPSAKKFVVAKTIEYDQFADLALASKICLIDHHDTMNEIGAVSHKYIDHLHSGAFLISDRNKDALENYAGVCYQGRRELEELVDFYLKNPVAREEKRRKQLDIAKNYTTSNTAKKLIAHFI